MTKASGKLKPKTRNKKLLRSHGFSLPEILIASFLLAFAVLSSVRMTTNAITSLSQTTARIQADSAIEKKMESLREKAFFYLCKPDPECRNSNYWSKEISYDTEVLKPICKTKSLGESFFHSLGIPGTQTEAIEGSFPPAEIKTEYLPSGNSIDIKITANITPRKVVMMSTITPNAQSWCP